MADLRLGKNTILLTLALFIFLAASRYAYGLKNYDNHPDLAKAMKYDSEKNGGDRKKADRRKAEYHYLRYLEDAKDSFQRAKVYCQLGSMYAVSFNREKGEKRNYAKARKYYRKVLELEPERIDACIIEARSMLVAFDNPYGFEQLKARLALYKWLSGINEKKLKEKWLPMRPPSRTAPEVESITNDKGQVVARITRKPPSDPNVPPPQIVIGLMNLIKDVKYGAIYNAAHWDIISMPVPEKGWAYILEHLPDDAPERKIVEEAIRKKKDRIADTALHEMPKCSIKCAPH
jgi:tetratricopeptide (TPR) repeat protein